jgi:hypothetical protein
MGLGPTPGVQTNDCDKSSTTSTNPKRGILMKARRTGVNVIAFLTFSAMLMAGQMQMPTSTAGTSKSAGASAAPKTLTGTVSDSMCGAQHMAKDKSAAECTRECVKQGTKYALVVGKKGYTLEGHEAELDKLAGMKATVKGKVTGEIVAVQSVESAMKMK